MESLLKSSRSIVLQSYTTGTANTAASSVLDLSTFAGGCSGLYIQHVINSTATTASVTFSVQGSATTAAASFATLNINSTALTLSTTLTQTQLLVDILHPHYRYIRTVISATGTAMAGATIVTAYDVRSQPTTQASTYVAGQILAASPTT